MSTAHEEHIHEEHLYDEHLYDELYELEVQISNLNVEIRDSNLRIESLEFRLYICMRRLEESKEYGVPEDHGFPKNEDTIERLEAELSTRYASLKAQESELRELNARIEAF